jgi:hypothetical protein
MLKTMQLPISLVVMVLVVGSCSSPTKTSSSKNTTTAQTDSQPVPSSTSQTGTTTPCPTPSPDVTRKILITAPCDGSKVAQRHFVEGIVADPNAHVWVIIHPMEVADYWVQPSVTIREGGRWKVLCYFGEPGAQHSGKHYEIVAITNPKKGLSEGQLIAGWPESESRSQVTEVVRE